MPTYSFGIGSRGPRRGVVPVKAPSLCVQCGVRWRQSSKGLCRQCERAAGDTRTTRDLDRERLERLKAKASFEQTVAMPTQREPRIVVIENQEYEVVWDGSDGSLSGVDQPLSPGAVDPQADPTRA